MKKITAIILSMTLLAGLFTGCGSAEAEDTAPAETVVEESADAEAVEATADATNAGQAVTINIGALKGPTSMGMVKLMDDSSNGLTGTNEYNFTIAGAADELTPQFIQGNLDIVAVPANLASVLYNKTEGNVTVLAINTMGILYIVGHDDSVQSVEDLKGKTIYASGKGATPEYALNYMLTANGIDPENDVTIEYMSEHSECVTAIANDPDAVAMLPQPFVTTAQMQDDTITVQLDMTEEWEKAAKEDGNDIALITGVYVVRNEFLAENPEAVALFMEQCQASVEYVVNNTEDAAQLIENYDIIKAAVAAKALPYCNIVFTAGKEMKAGLSGYLEVLYEQNPESVGGQVPNEDFYYSGK